MTPAASAVACQCVPAAFTASAVVATAGMARTWRLCIWPLCAIAGWAGHVIMVATLEVAACIEAATRAGVHFPENRCDNNLVACALLSGWIAPASAALLAGIAASGLRRPSA